MKENFQKTGYEYINHTADAGLKAYGKNIEELFVTAATGMFNIIADVSSVEIKTKKSLSIQASRIDELLKIWLSELLYLHSSEHFIFKKFRVKITNSENKNFSLKGTAEGEPFNPEKHILLAEIKTVTYHQLSVKKRNDYWEANVIFDL
ncbi:archease [candidate division KSB1 bacterium]|nr:MAG: archease [candidate division KSB1 bacterium]